MAYRATHTSDPFEVWTGLAFKASSSRTGIVHSGGRGSNETGPLSDQYNGPINSFLADCGYPSIAVSPGTTWGNDTIQASLTAAKNAGQASYGFASGKVYLRGGSMGALNVLNWTVNNPTLVKAMVLTTPVTDLAYMHDNNIGGWATEIETAYGGLAAYQAALATHNPAQNTASLTGIPILVCYSTDDPYIPPSQAQSFAATVGGTAVSMGAVGHSVQGLAAEQVSNFFAAHP